MNAHALLNTLPDTYLLDEPTYAGLPKDDPDRLEAHGAYGLIQSLNNAYPVGRAYVLPKDAERVTVGVVFQATKFAAAGVARGGFNVYLLRESGRYVAHRPRTLA